MSNTNMHKHTHTCTRMHTHMYACHGSISGDPCSTHCGIGNRLISKLIQRNTHHSTQQLQRTCRSRMQLSLQEQEAQTWQRSMATATRASVGQRMPSSAGLP